MSLCREAPACLLAHILVMNSTLHDSEKFGEVVVREELSDQILIPQIHYESKTFEESTDQMANVVQLSEGGLLVLLF